MKELLQSAAARAIDYLQSLGDRSVAPLPQAVSRLASLDRPLPEQPSPPQAVLKMLDETCSDAAMAMAGPCFFGFVIGGSLPVTLAANWLAGAWDQNSAYYNAMPATSFIEQVALRWVLELFGLPSACGGAFVTGGTMANFCGLAAARHAVLARVGWDVEADGLIGAPPVTVILSEEAHPSVTKSLGLLGFGRKRVARVPTDNQGRMRAEKLPRISGPAIVCAQIGNVNTGAFDPVRQIGEAAHAAGAWLHVDGAFGLWAMADPAMAERMTGVVDADSWATDFHK